MTAECLRQSEVDWMAWLSQLLITRMFSVISNVYTLEQLSEHVCKQLGLGRPPVAVCYQFLCAYCINKECTGADGANTLEP